MPHRPQPARPGRQAVCRGSRCASPARAVRPSASAASSIASGAVDRKRWRHRSSRVSRRRVTSSVPSSRSSRARTTRDGSRCRRVACATSTDCTGTSTRWAPRRSPSTRTRRRACSSGSATRSRPDAASARNWRVSEARDIGGAYAYARRLGLPVLLKPNDSSSDQQVSVAYTRAQFYAAAREVFAASRKLLVQRIARGSDCSIVVLDDEVLMATEKTRAVCHRRWPLQHSHADRRDPATRPRDVVPNGRCRSTMFASRGTWRTSARRSRRCRAPVNASSCCPAAISAWAVTSAW